MDAKRTAAVIAANRDTIVGIKTAHYAGPEWDPVDRAVEAGNLTNTPVMVDFGIFRVERPHSELVLKHLRPGDIYTHLYLERVPMLDASGKLRTYLLEARKRGIKFDMGHGGGSFVWRYAVPATQQGFYPDSISTDLHVSSMVGGMKDMTNVMSKISISICRCRTSSRHPPGIPRARSNELSLDISPRALWPMFPC
jgi:dihydroorotase